MQSFIIGKVVEPVIKNTANGNVFKFGVLSGRTCQEFSVFSFNKDFKTGEMKENPFYEKVSGLQENDLVTAVIGTSVTNNGNLAIYLNDIAQIDEELRADFLSRF